MKKMLVLGLFVSSFSMAAQIHSATYDASTDSIVVDLTYGGCNLEDFTLTWGPCMETFPMQTRGTIDDSRDICRAMIRTKKSYSLEGMDCRPAHASIQTSKGIGRVPVYIPEASEQN